MKHHFLYILLIFFSIISCKKEPSDQLQIAAASNMQYPIKELIVAFEKQTTIKVNVSISSSGKITNQIKNGAPFEVFLSADMAYPENLYKNNFTFGPAKPYAFGKLVLWTASTEKPSIEALKNKQIKHIAIGNPRLAPYGIAAKQVLEKYDFYEALKDKFVFGESITQVNQFISSGAADVGFTAMAVVKSPNNRTIGKWIIIPDSLYKPIGQGIVMIQQKDKTNHNAQLFYDFIFSNEARQILKNYGYSFE